MANCFCSALVNAEPLNNFLIPDSLTMLMDPPVLYGPMRRREYTPTVFCYGHCVAMPGAKQRTGSSICPSLDEVVGDCARTGNAQVGVVACNGRQNLVAVEPCHVGHFFRVDDDILIQGNAVAANHQR